MTTTILGHKDFVTGSQQYSIEDNDHNTLTYFGLQDVANQQYDPRLYPSKAEFDEIVEDYLQNLSIKKRDKALIDRDRYRLIIKVLKDPRNTSILTAQFRFWVKKMFKLVHSNTVDIIYHDNKPVAMREDVFDILMHAHREAHHGGRDKTSALVRCRYSWIPKELIARFVRQCPFCITRRNAREKGADCKSIHEPHDVQDNAAQAKLGAVARLNIADACEPPSPRAQAQAYLIQVSVNQQTNSVWETWRHYAKQEHNEVASRPMSTHRDSNNFYNAFSSVIPTPFSCAYQDGMTSGPNHQLAAELNQPSMPFHNVNPIAPPVTPHQFWQGNQIGDHAATPFNYFPIKSEGSPFADYGQNSKDRSDHKPHCNPAYIAAAAAAIAAAGTGCTSHPVYAGPVISSVIGGPVRTTPSPSPSYSSLSSPMQSPPSADDGIFTTNIPSTPLQQISEGCN